MRLKQSYYEWGLALLALTAARVLMGALVPLTPDEAYYRLWALAPAAGYLDHPPMVAVFIRLGLLLGGDTACGVRLMGPFSAAVGTLLLAMATRDWLQVLRGYAPDKAKRAGLRTAVLLNGTVALGVGTLLMTPDTPLLLFMALMVWSLSRLCTTGKGAWWLVVGAAVGLGFDSKYTAVLPAAGMGIWLLLTSSGRQWLKTCWPWLGGLVAAVFVSPVVYWNATHHWASFMKQGGRTGDWHPAKMLTYFSELLGGQIGLASPGVFLFFVGGCVLLWKCRDSFSRLLLCIILLPLAVFLQHAVGARVQANWPVVLYPALTVAAALPLWRGWKAASGLGVTLVLLIVIQAVASPLKLSPHFDMTLRQMGGWPTFSREVVARVPANSFLIADEYGLAAELAFYAPLGKPVMAVEPRWDLFTFPAAPCGDGYLIRSRRRHDLPDGAFFKVLGQEPDIARARDGAVGETYAIYHVQMQCTAAGQSRNAVLLPTRN
ncbi:glycosyltransferase family 39 protein [Acetobacter senegalensis]|uniref:Glycosyl/arabinosyl/mannosyl transferase n=1 Tax=Acetobacter tropicalis NBRC 101654 TaxID=749388 RepID=F7VAU0_9PROT|nr:MULTISPECIES: glycosyltransferase family 39 protein [Acetobacter]MCG4253225.1 glycosyltransferase family 39 protein [Acetobacter senegalensis]GAA07485.1 glycosyl/arabinosyl/mannosyl transferase [Acetobacter tropicalis NBRC 101654]